MIQLWVPGELKYRALVVHAVAAACRLVGAGGPQRSPGSRRFDDEVISAFGEAFNNVAIHGYRGRVRGDVHIEIEPSEGAIEIRIKDFGASFDLSRVPPPKIDDLPESGLGVFIMRSFMDEVSYRPGSPNVLSLSKRLSDDNRGPSGASP
jgi:serine/threonine-protein kinase RsbW